MLKIIAVCGMGIGTSVLLKMNTDKALKKLGMKGDVQAADVGVAKGAARDADIVLTSAELAGELGSLPIPVKVVNNFMNVDEIAAAISDAMEK